MSKRGTGTGVKPEDELTEIVKAEIVRVDGVIGPANGTPPLLMKALPDSDVAPALELLAKTSKKKGPDGEKPEKDDEVEPDEDDVEKAEMSTGEINDLPDSAFAHIEPGGTKDDEGKTTPRKLRHYPIHDKAHADNAAARAAQQDDAIAHAALPKIKAAQAKFGSKSDDVKKADGDEMAPGSPAWEAEDAARLRTAATQLADLRAKVSASRDREAQEDEPYDWENASDLDCAVQAIECALSIVGRLAFTEAVESYSGDGMAKAGRRLSGRSIDAIKTARDHLTNLLGPDGEEPEPKEEETEVTKEQMDAALAEAVAKGQQQVVSALADHGRKAVLKAFQASTPTGAPSTPPGPAGVDMKSGTGPVGSEASRQGARLPGMNPPATDPSTPALSGEPSGGLPSGEVTGAGSTAKDAGAEMGRVKAAETAGDANPALVKSEKSKKNDGVDAEVLAKSLLEPVMKSLDERFAPLSEGLEAVRKRVEEVANAPMPGGPLLKGAVGQQFDYLRHRPAADAALLPDGSNAGDLLKAVDGIEDPVARAQITRALAVRTHPALQRT